MVAGVILPLQARTDSGAGQSGAPSANPIGANPESISRGQQNYLASCLACHGPGGVEMVPRPRRLMSPADLTLSRARTHRDEDLSHWIQNGFVGPAMPAFADTLDEDEIWDTINDIRSLQNAVVRDIPQPEDCTVEPFTIEEPGPSPIPTHRSLEVRQPCDGHSSRPA